MKNRHLPKWQRMIAMPAKACHVGDAIECSACTEFEYPSKTILYLFIGLTIVYGKESRKQNTKPEGLSAVISV